MQIKNVFACLRSVGSPRAKKNAVSDSFITNKHMLKDYTHINKLTTNTQTHTDTQNNHVNSFGDVHNFRHVPACMYWFLLRNT